MVLYELAWCLTARKGTMVSLKELANKTGFRSVFAFSDRDAALIQAAGHSRGFAQYEPWACDLLVDIDQDDYVEEAEQNIKALGWRYSAFFSGNRGRHYHIPTTLVHGYGLPEYFASLARQVHPNADMSLYRPNSIFRLTGTKHQKTGKYKTFLHAGGHKLLILPEHIEGVKPVITFAEKFGEGLADELVLGLGALQGAYNRCPDKGRRSNYLWAVGKGLYAGGLSGSAVAELLNMLNNSWGVDAKDEAELQRITGDACK